MLSCSKLFHCFLVGKAIKKQHFKRRCHNTTAQNKYMTDEKSGKNLTTILNRIDVITILFLYFYFI